MQQLSVRRVSTFTASRYIKEAITCVHKGADTMMHLIATIKTIITPKLAEKSLVIITIQIMTFFKVTLPILIVKEN